MVVLAFLTLFVVDNAEFFRVAAEQKAEGYRWVEVGKSVPSGTPAILIKPDNRNPYILYRLEK